MIVKYDSCNDRGYTISKGVISNQANSRLTVCSCQVDAKTSSSSRKQEDEQLRPIKASKWSASASTCHCTDLEHSLGLPVSDHVSTI